MAKKDEILPSAMCKCIDQYKTNSIARRIVDEDNPREAQLVDDVVKEMSWNGVNRKSAIRSVGQNPKKK